MSLYRSKAKHMLFFFFKYVFIWLTAFETYSKNTATLYFLFFPNAHEQNDMLFLLLFVISGDTEKQTKSCPRRYLKSPQKESLETSWEVPKTSKNVKKIVLGQNRKITKKYKNQIEKKRFKSPPLRHGTFPKRTFSQKTRFFYRSFF